jgi:hypothetical protein
MNNYFSQPLAASLALLATAYRLLSRRFAAR